jgi:5-formaminoimidazole-4-carboxamide-1-beta-D-ribofuranosyl 5'-monophosphate synthetase
MFFPSHGLLKTAEQSSWVAAWLEAAGMKVPRKVDSSVDVIVEMSHGFAFDAAEVKAKIHKIKKIKAGDGMYLD